MPLTVVMLRDGSASVARIAGGKSFSSPAVASILSAEESAISRPLGPCTRCAKPVTLGVLGLVPCHSKTQRIAAGMSATPTRAEIRPLIGRFSPSVVAGGRLVSDTGELAWLFLFLS